jgi:hypothetical protein
LNGGIATAFTVAALISIAAVILAFFIRNSKPPMDEQSMEHATAGSEQSASDQPATTP